MPARLARRHTSGTVRDGSQPPPTALARFAVPPDLERIGQLLDTSYAMTGLSIGALAKQADAKIQTIRYYEQIGMLPPVSRTTGGQRRYTGAHRDRLRFIRHARELGFSLDSIRDLLDLADRPDRDCAEADRIARSHLGTVRERIAALQALEAELSRMVAECAGGRVAECRVIEVLSDHTECRYHASTGRQVALGSTPNPTGTS